MRAPISLQQEIKSQCTQRVFGLDRVSEETLVSIVAVVSLPLWLISCEKCRSDHK